MLCNVILLYLSFCCIIGLDLRLSFTHTGISGKRDHVFHPFTALSLSALCMEQPHTPLTTFCNMSLAKSTRQWRIKINSSKSIQPSHSQCPHLNLNHPSRMWLDRRLTRKERIKIKTEGINNKLSKIYRLLYTNFPNDL